ncbi:50S ribosomal protein L5 [bacterium endosymbiont of Pedicinus badii]|uniref:50S ribosomal protein L5 n=1 Tax=bacterium endosymbiont of Pedicinus badii TaxID=1719126 RepID=UPI0009BAF5C1|nr:50S ribosomal protein L5 [bacterium endosymbiont of Pedicinus badii]OQM34111.1 50S ribosomal protein L5 [bacterium endosymbiont of Pedicinus badii]
MKEYYKSKIVHRMMEKFSYKSIMQVPKIKKIVINIGVGKSILDKKFLENAIVDLQKISCQKPIVTKAKKSISSFKLRQGYAIGCKVTLRKNNMWNFLKKIIFIAIPRIRDFRGFSKKSFDQKGNYNIGIREQIIFPEIDYEKIDCIRGMNITLVTSAKSKIEGYELLKFFGFPFYD